MESSDFRSVTVYDPKGLPIPLAEAHDFSVSFRKETFASGYALYVTAESRIGFPADAAIAFSPFEADTGDYLAINNHSDFWCRPFWGDSLSKLPQRIQELLIRKENTFACYLPLVSDTYKTLIRGSAEGGFEFYLYSNVDGLTACKDQLSYIYLEDTDPMRLLTSIAAIAAERLGNGLRMRSERTVSPIFEYLGWCSWDALQIRINHEDMLNKAREFKEKGVPVGFAIFDDMWADAPLLSYVTKEFSRKEQFRTMHASMLRSFEGDPIRFPKGMKAAVEDLKREGIPYVGIWFPTTGYWAGLQPGGEIAEKTRALTVLSEENRQILVAPEEEKASAFFDLLCGRAASWGGDFVKIDNQGFHKRYRNLAPIGQSAHALQTAIDGATAKHFDGAVINCMGMPSECMYNRQSSAISRCSDDFLPESRPWFAKNVLQCAYNGLLQGQFYVNDWDMWWTDDEQAKKNSLCRAISGGPIYVSDMIGRTNPEILRPLILSDGHILRCDESATPTADCLMQNPTESGRPFKIRNRIGDSAVVALFNIDAENRSVTGTLSPDDAGLPEGEYVYYEYFSGACGTLDTSESIGITLSDNDDFRLYTFLPKYDRFTLIGRTDLFIGAKAVVSRSSRRFTLAEGGPIAIYSEEPVAVFANGSPLPQTRENRLTRVILPSDVTEIEILQPSSK